MFIFNNKKIEILFSLVVKSIKYNYLTVIKLLLLIKMQDFPIETLPTWIITSNHFKDFRELYPSEIVFPCLENVMADAASISIESYDDIDRIIRADYILGYSEQTMVEIFKNVNDFWMLNPNSAPVRLPDKDNTWLGMQIRELLECDDRCLIMNCMKLNYVPLFKYKVQTDNTAIQDAQSYSSVYNLLYYAVNNNNIEILEAGIEAGCVPQTGNLLKVSYEKKCLPITKILLERRINNYHITLEVLDVASSEGSLEQLIYTIEWMKRNQQAGFIRFSPKIAAKNVENFRYLYENGYIVIEMPQQLLGESVVRGLPLENIQMIEEIAKISVKEIVPTDIYTGNNIFDALIFRGAFKNNNIELYNYLRANGFRVTEEVIGELRKKPTNFSLGLIKKHIEEDKQKQ